MSDDGSEREYLVRWAVDIDAPDPVEAARRAMELQRNPQSVATVFEVRWTDTLGDAYGTEQTSTVTVDLATAGRVGACSDCWRRGWLWMAANGDDSRAWVEACGNCRVMTEEEAAAAAVAWVLAQPAAWQAANTAGRPAVAWEFPGDASGQAPYVTGVDLDAAQRADQPNRRPAPASAAQLPGRSR